LNTSILPQLDGYIRSNELMFVLLSLVPTERWRNQILGSRVLQD